MRIVLDLQACQATDSRQRGIGRYSLSLAEAMAREAGDHELWIALNAAFSETIRPLRQRFANHVPPERVVVFDTPRPGSESDPRNDWRARTAALCRESFLASLSPDIVHVSSLFGGLVDDAVASVGRLEHPPTAVTLYDLIPYRHPEVYLANEVNERWYRRQIDDLRRADLLLAISEYTRMEAIDAIGVDPERVVNVSGDADPQFRPIALPEAEERELRARLGLEKPFVMYTGGLDFRKNLETLIQAYGLLPAPVRSAHPLAIVCQMTPGERRRLESLGARAGLAPGGLVFPGFVTDDELVALYNLCHLFVFPSLHEGFGLPVLEAMRCGAPVVASNRSSLPEVVGLADALFDPSSPGDIAARIHRGLTDEGFRDLLGQNSREQQARFSWDQCARTALNAFEAMHPASPAQSSSATSPSIPAKTPRDVRPRMAYVSPIAPERSGISDYGAELLPVLADHYEIDLVTTVSRPDDPWLCENLRWISPREFAASSNRYDRALYHFGNSQFHTHMPELLEEAPGVVVLHDTFLAHMIREIAPSSEGNGSGFAQWLVESHGCGALEYLREHGEDRTVWEYPCSLAPIENAVGVIVHSEFARGLIREWYGSAFDERVRVIPLLRGVTKAPGRVAARAALHLGPDEFVVCSFGVLGETKLSQRLLEAWDQSRLAVDPRCRLVFVGDGSSPYAKELESRLKLRSGPSRVEITGYATPDQYQGYLAAADVAVQLRASSRGETSRAVLDCLGHGLPVIVNSHGAAAELPAGVAHMITEGAPTGELAHALESLFDDHDARDTLAREGRAYLERDLAPARIACRYRDAIEELTGSSPLVPQGRLVTAIGDLSVRAPVSDADVADAARCIEENTPVVAQRQLLVDVSILVELDAKTGIQRVVRNIARCLLRHPASSLRVQLVYRSGVTYRYAHDFCAGLLDLNDISLEDAVVSVRPGDLFLGLDLDARLDERGWNWIRRQADRGMETVFVLYDLLPISHPQYFTQEMLDLFPRWLGGVADHGMGVACISESVADQLETWLNGRENPPRVGTFRLGADFVPPRPAHLGAGELGLLQPARGRPFFLMVGTLEPRKRHEQVLGALDALWARGVDVGLVIVGKAGWDVDELTRRIRDHEEAGGRLLWLEGASDALLGEAYAQADALIQASESEGFGLPLVEAAQFGLPIIARDIPVFREVAGEHAFYFSGGGPESLADRLQEWLELRAEGGVPTTDGMEWLTWEQSTEDLLDLALNGRWRP